MHQPLTIKTGIVIQKTIAEVFEAMVDPDQMKNYFISGSSGKMEEGKVLQWRFPEMDMSFPIRVGKVDKNKYISFFWNDIDGTETFVEINLTMKPLGVFVQVTEKGRVTDDNGIAWYGRNTEGWANFLACMKAWLEYNIHLRKGAFDPSQLPADN